MVAKANIGKSFEGLRSAGSSLIDGVTRLCRRAFGARYRPELHYMRGPRTKGASEASGRHGKPGQ